MSSADPLEFISLAGKQHVEALPQYDRASGREVNLETAEIPGGSSYFLIPAEEETEAASESDEANSRKRPNQKWHGKIASGQYRTIA